MHGQHGAPSRERETSPPKKKQRQNHELQQNNSHSKSTNEVTKHEHELVNKQIPFLLLPFCGGALGVTIQWETMDQLLDMSQAHLVEDYALVSMHMNVCCICIRVPVSRDLENMYIYPAAHHAALRGEKGKTWMPESQCEYTGDGRNSQEKRERTVTQYCVEHTGWWGKGLQYEEKGWTHLCLCISPCLDRVYLRLTRFWCIWECFQVSWIDYMDWCLFLCSFCFLSPLPSSSCIPIV